MNTHFDATVSYWDEVYRSGGLQGVIYQERQAAVLEYVDASGLPTEARALEIGCGAGHLTVELARRGLRVNAVDSSPGMVELTARQAREAQLDGQVEVTVADVHALPFESEHFDLVVAVGVLPWLHSPGTAIVEMARVLRTGGELVLTADSGARLSSFTDPRGLLALTPLRRIYHKMRHSPGQAVSYLYFPGRIDRLVRRAGLTMLSRRTVGFGPLSFMGRALFGERRGVRIHERLQALADSGTVGLRSAGWHYVLRAAKGPASSRRS